MNTTGKERKLNLDYLRVFATLATITLHVAAQNWQTTDINGFEWQVFNIYNSIVRWCVPVFVMISGALFLNKNLTLKTIYSKYILRLIIAFGVWSSFYTFLYTDGKREFVKYFIIGPYHLWFIWMIIALYMAIPFLKLLTEKEIIIKYYIVLSIVFAFIIPTVGTIINHFGNEDMRWIMDSIITAVNSMKFNVVLGFSSYFVLGNYIYNKELSKKQRIIIYLTGILGFIMTILLSSISSVKLQKHLVSYYSEFSFNVLLESIAVFTSFKYVNWSKVKLDKVISTLSKYSFAIYLIHIWVLDRLQLSGVNTLSMNPIISVPVISIIVFLISIVIAAILNHIPIVKKYIV